MVSIKFVLITLTNNSKSNTVVQFFLYEIEDERSI